MAKKVKKSLNKAAPEKMPPLRTGNIFSDILETSAGAPVFQSTIRAGFQNIIEDDIEKTISLDKEFEIDSPSTFIFNVMGDSMIDLGIYEGDMVVVKKTADIDDNDIVIANADGIYTIKICRKKDSRIWLEAANPSYKPIKPKFKIEIFGRVTGLVRKIG